MMRIGRPTRAMQVVIDAESDAMLDAILDTEATVSSIARDMGMNAKSIWTRVQRARTRRYSRAVWASAKQERGAS